MRRALVAVVAVAALGACHHGSAPPPATLRVHVEAEPPTLNPLVEHDAWTTWITLNTICEPLVRQTASGAFEPALAASFTASPDATKLTFTLRDGVRFHDGAPLTAGDVLFTFDRVRGPGAAPDQRADFADVTAIDHPDPRTIALRFARPAPLALQAIARLCILPAHAFTDGDLRPQAASRAPIGTGPFRFVEWRAGDRIVLARNDDYWGPKPKLDRIELRIVADREAAFELARRGEIDLLWRLTPAQVDRPPPAGMHVVAWHLPAYSFVVWNLRRPPLGDVRVRQALALLTDRDRYLRAAYRGRATAVDEPYPLGSPSYDRAIPAWPYDPARAAQLLDAAGLRDSDGDGRRELDGKPIELTFLLVAGSKTLEPLATMLQEDLRKVGITLRIEAIEWASLLEKLRAHAFDAAALQWAMQPVQSNYQLFHSSEAERGQNYGGFRDPETDRLLDELQHAPPGPARWALDHALARRLHDEQPYVFLGCPEIDSLVSDRVRGYAPSATGLGLAALSVEGGAAR